MAECDGCHEDWPRDFFCERCSGEAELAEVRRPVVMWDYLGGDTEIVEEYVYRSICLNCCPGHREKEGSDGERTKAIR